MSSVPSGWTKVASFSSGFEADIAVSTLNTAGIPAVALGHQLTGIFGPGFQGRVAGGIDVQVPAAMLDDAWEILTSMTPRVHGTDD